MPVSYSIWTGRQSVDIEFVLDLIEHRSFFTSETDNGDGAVIRPFAK